jgi:MFS family permease
VAVRDLRLYLGALAVSETGSTAMMLVAGIWTKALTGSDTAAGLISACLYAPSLLAPLAGLLADRVPRRRLLVVVHLGAAAGLLPLLLVDSAGYVPLLFAVMLGYGAVLVLTGPAETALFAELVPEGERGAVNGLRLTVQEGAKLVAPLAGAALFSVAGGAAVAVADAATFVVAALAVSALRVPPRPPAAGDAAPGEPAPSWWHEITAGWHHVRRTPALAALVAAGAAVMGLSGIPVAAQYALVDALHRPPAFLGVLVSVLGAGSIAAGLSVGPVLRRVDERRLVLVACACGVTGYLLLGTGSLVPVLVGRFAQGFFLPWALVAVITAGQRLTPDALRGRVASLITLALFGPVPLVQALGAVAFGGVDFRLTYLVTAACVAVVGVLLLRSRPAA